MQLRLLYSRIITAVLRLHAVLPAKCSYDLGLIGGALLHIKQALSISSSITLEAIVSAAKFGATCGTFLGGAAMLRYGRRRAIAATSVFFTAGPLLMAMANTPWCGLPRPASARC